MGPAAPTSKRIALRTVGPLRRMKAPTVPMIEKYGGKGMK
jgi:hypothetical protein